MTGGQRRRSARKRPAFLLSLPERAVRQVLGTAGHAARTLTHVVVPPAIRGTRFWNSAVERSLRILAEGVGHVESGGALRGSEVDVARQAVGSVVDTAALLVFHVSPLWVLAIVNDVAKGSRQYLDEVLEELRARGALERGVRIEGVDHLLSILERTSDRLQSDVDRPPLSVEELRRSVEAVRNALDNGSRDEIEADARALADELETASRVSGGTVREVSNAVAVSLASRAKLAGRAAKAGVDVAARAVVVKGWLPYVEQLRRVRDRGFARYLAEAAAPLGAAFTTNFDPATDTLTEKLFTGETWARALDLLRR